LRFGFIVIVLHFRSRDQALWYTVTRKSVGFRIQGDCNKELVFVYSSMLGRFLEEPPSLLVRP
jgi:hypothetical protein